MLTLGVKRTTNRLLNTLRLKTPVVGTAKIHWLIDLIQLSYVNISMNNSAEENNPEVFPGNKTGGIHCRKSLILPKKQTNKQTNKKTQHNTTQNKTKQKLAITKNTFIVRGRRLRGLFPIANRRKL